MIMYINMTNETKSATRSLATFFDWTHKTTEPFKSQKNKNVKIC